MIRTAVIMARGLGTRMRRGDSQAVVSVAQAAVANEGLKGMIPIERPFLEYVISALADAGIRRVVMVVAPGPNRIREHFSRQPGLSRVNIEWAEQAQPVGTADAVLCAAGVVGNEPFIVLNADNYYPVQAYAALAELEAPAVVAFDRHGLARDGNISENRLRSFAALDISPDGWLRGIVEKPGHLLDPGSDAARWVGMNLWSLNSEVVDACRRVPRSSRGEYELPEAVALALSEGLQVRAVTMAAAVLDLSQQSDIASVVEKLSGVTPVL